MSALAAPLRVPAFRRLATTYTLNELGWGFGTVALAVLVLERTGSALATTLLFLATTFLPALVAPALTARLDALPVRRALPRLYLLEAALFAALVVASRRFSLPVVIALALADGAVAIVGRALTRAAVAAALNPVHALEAGNQILNVCFSISFAIGPAIAAGVVVVAGVSASLAVTATLFLVMAVALATARTLPFARGAADRSWLERLRDGIEHVRGRPTVHRVLRAHATALTLAAAVTPIEVVYVRESLHAGPGAYGLLLAAWGTGTVLSSLWLARLRGHTRLRRIPLSAATMGLGYLVMAVAPSLTVALVGGLVGGAGNGVYYVSVVQAIQDRVGDDFQARVMGLLESTTAACYGAGFLLGGTLAALTGPRAVIAVAGAGGLVAATAIGALLRGDRVAPAPALADSDAVAPAAAPEPAHL